MALMSNLLLAGEGGHVSICSLASQLSSGPLLSDLMCIEFVFFPASYTLEVDLYTSPFCHCHKCLR